MQKIKRDAFLYMAPHENSPEEEFAQCETCRMSVPDTAFPEHGGGSRCVALGSKERIVSGGSCGAYLIWPKGTPNKEAVKEHAKGLSAGSPGSATKEELGYVERAVRCENCAFYDAVMGRCQLFVTMNQNLPRIFDLDPMVDAHGCCNANTAI